MRKIKSQKIRIHTEMQGLTRKQKIEEDKLSRMPDRSPALIALYMIGVFGLLTVFWDAAGYTIGKPLLVLIILGVELLNLVLWYIFIYQNKYFMYLILGLCTLSIVMIIPMWGSIISSVSALTSGKSQDLSGLAERIVPFAVLLITMLFFYLEFVLRRHSITFLVCMGVVIFAPLAGIRMNLLSVVCIVIFQFGFYVLNTNISLKGSRLKVRDGARASALSTVAVAVLLLVSFVPALIAEHIFEDSIFMQVYQADGYLQDAINVLFGNLSTNIADGTVSRGNLRQSGKPVFDLYVQELPEDRLYLKGYVGGIYDGNRWQNAYMQDYTVVEYLDSDSETKNRYRRRGYSFVREPFVLELINNIYQDKYKLMLEHIGSLTGKKLVSFDYDYRQGYCCCFTEDGTEVAVKCELPYDIVSVSEDGVSPLDDPVPAYIFSENAPDKFFGAELANQVELYELHKEENGGYDNFETDYYDCYIEDSVYIDMSELPALPSVLNITTSSEVISDIYTTFGRKDMIYNKDTRGFEMTGDTSALSSAVLDGSQSIYFDLRDGQAVNMLYPYYPVAGRGFGSMGAADGITSRSYSTDYYPSGKISMGDRWGDLGDYKTFTDQYYERAVDAYTDIITSHPRLEEYCRDNPLDSSNIYEITTFILYTLQTHAKYTTTPGSVPFYADTTDHFLFSNHQGYCVHFATAAALMYRMYGIPARYATGYSVSTSLFTETGDRAKNDVTGTVYNFSAEVSDKSAHAWVEIFLPDHGWVPVEVTPTMDGRMIARFPGYDSAVMANIMKEHGWEFVDRNENGDAVSGGGAADDDAEGDSFITMVIIAALIIIISALLFIAARYIHSVRFMENMSCRAAFDRLIRLMHYCGLLEGLYGSEKGFAEKLCEALPGTDSAALRRMMLIVEAESFSENTAGEEDSEFVRRLYAEIARSLYAKEKWYRKPVFRFIRCFI